MIKINTFRDNVIRTETQYT